MNKIIIKGQIKTRLHETITCPICNLPVLLSGGSEFIFEVPFDEIAQKRADLLNLHEEPGRVVIKLDKFPGFIYGIPVELELLE